MPVSIELSSAHETIQITDGVGSVESDPQYRNTQPSGAGVGNNRVLPRDNGENNHLHESESRVSGGSIAPWNLAAFLHAGIANLIGP